MRVKYPVFLELVEVGDMPRLRIGLRVIKCEDDFQGVMIDPLPLLGLMHGFGKRKALPGEKLLAVVADRVNDKCVPLPLAGRVTHIVGVQIGGNFSTIRPDFAPIVIILEVLQQPVASRDDLKWSGCKIIARRTERITIEHSSCRDELHVGLVLRLPPRRKTRQRRGMAIQAEPMSLDVASPM